MTICIDCGTYYDDLAPWQIRLGCTDKRCWDCQDDYNIEIDRKEKQEKEEKSRRSDAV